MKKLSRRQGLELLVGSGVLRDALEKYNGIDPEVIELAIDVCGRYCAPRRRPR